MAWHKNGGARSWHALASSYLLSILHLKRFNQLPCVEGGRTHTARMRGVHAHMRMAAARLTIHMPCLLPACTCWQHCLWNIRTSPSDRQKTEQPESLVADRDMHMVDRKTNQILPQTYMPACTYTDRTRHLRHGQKDQKTSILPVSLRFLTDPVSRQAGSFELRPLDYHTLPTHTCRNRTPTPLRTLTTTKQFNKFHSRRTGRMDSLLMCVWKTDKYLVW